MSEIQALIIALGVFSGAIAFLLQLPPVALTWQEVLLLVVAGACVVIVLAAGLGGLRHVIATDRKRMALLNDLASEVRKFLIDLTREVGEDGGKSLATRLHAQDERAEIARKLSEQRTAEWKLEQVVAKGEREHLREMVMKLEALVGMLQIQIGWGQQLAEARREAMEKGITLSVFNAAAQAQQQVTSARHDVNEVDVSGGAEQASAGQGNQQEEKA